MSYDNSRPKRPTQTTAVATPKSSLFKMKQQQYENVAVKSNRQGPQVPTNEKYHNHSVSDLEKNLKNLSLSKPSSSSNAKDAMFSILGKKTFHSSNIARCLPKPNLRSPEPLLRDDSFKCLMNLVSHTVGKCRTGEERSYHDRTRDLLRKFQFLVSYERRSEDGSCRPDLLVWPSELHELFIFECKAVKKINQNCINQLRRYVDTFGCTHGCLVNFGVWPPELFLMNRLRQKLDQILATEDVKVAKTSATKDAMENYINVPFGFTRKPNGDLCQVRDDQDRFKKFDQMLSMEGAKIATTTRDATKNYINTPSGVTRTHKSDYPITDIPGGSEQISNGSPVPGILPSNNRKTYQTPTTNRKNGAVHRSSSQLRTRRNKKDDFYPLGFTKRLNLMNKAKIESL